MLGSFGPGWSAVGSGLALAAACGGNTSSANDNARNAGGQGGADDGPTSCSQNKCDPNATCDDGSGVAPALARRQKRSK